VGKKAVRAEADVARGVHSSDAITRAEVARQEDMSAHEPPATRPTYTPGDVVNGHRLDADGVWRPVPQPPTQLPTQPGTPPFHKRPGGIVAIVVGCLALLGVTAARVALPIMLDDPRDREPGATSAEAPVRSWPTPLYTPSDEPAPLYTPEPIPVPTPSKPHLYDASSASAGQRWAEYKRLLSGDHISRMYWVTSHPRTALSTGYGPVVCGRTKAEEGVEALVYMAEHHDYTQVQLNRMSRSEVLFTQAYCPEKKKLTETAWNQYRTTIGEQAGAGETPEVEDFSIELQTHKKECFGLAGCTITYNIHVGYDGPSDLEGTYYVHYRVTGDVSGPKTNLFELTDGVVSYQEEESARTKSRSTVLKVTVTRIEME